MLLVASILSFPTCLGVKDRPFPYNSGCAPLCCCTRPHSKRLGEASVPLVTRLGTLISLGHTHRIADDATARSSGYN